MTHPGSANSREKMTSRGTWAFIVFALVAAYLLATQHRAHLSGLLYYLPYLALLACPLMHLFHHRGHGHGHGRTADASRTDDERR